MSFAAGALIVLAFAALPSGASAAEMETHCSFAPCEGSVESTGNAVLTEDSGTNITCTKTTGTVTQSAATSTTVSATLTFEGWGYPLEFTQGNTGIQGDRIWTVISHDLVSNATIVYLTGTAHLNYGGKLVTITC